MAEQYKGINSAQHDLDSDRSQSKSQRKRDMQALQDIGRQLVLLSTEQLARVEMPEDLRLAVQDARRFSMEARRRQLQYIGKLMRRIDASAIQKQLDRVHGISKEETARHHRLERLRSDLMADETTLARIIATWPHADLQRLRTLRRNALKEQAQARPPSAFREIFKLLRQIDDNARAEVASLAQLLEGEEEMPS